MPIVGALTHVVDRVSAWLTEVVPSIDAGTILVVGHRATFFALEHLLDQVTLHEAVTSSWAWRPGWIYQLPAS